MKQERKQELIKNILLSNLSKEDKNDLIEYLQENDVTLDDFMKHILTLLKIGKEALIFFDIDLGDF